MSERIENLQFNGQPPSIVGELCSGLVVQQCYEGAQLTNHANVVYFLFKDVWHRIYFEPGMVFWRAGDAPWRPVNSTIAYGLVLNDLSEMTGVVGHHLASVSYAATPQGDVTASFVFIGGASMSLKYDAGADSTWIDA